MTILLTDLIFHKKKILSREECAYLIEEYHKLQENNSIEQCPEATSGVMTTSSFKRGILQPYTEARKIIFSATEKMINEYMDYLDSFGMFHIRIRQSMLYSHMYRLLKYDPGTKIHPHVDHAPYVYGSCTFNLNEEYTGGDFVFWKGKHRVKLERGDGLIFPADFMWVHEVEKIITGTRYSTNSFLQQIPEPLKTGVYNFVDSALNSEECYEYSLTEKYNIKHTV